MSEKFSIPVPAVYYQGYWYVAADVYSSLKSRGFYNPSLEQFIKPVSLQEFNRISELGKPENIVFFSDIPKSAVEQAKQQLASQFKTSPKDIVVTDIKIKGENVEVSAVSRQQVIKAVEEERKILQQIQETEKTLKQLGIPYQKIVKDNLVHFQIQADYEKIRPHISELKKLGFNIKEEQLKIDKIEARKPISGTYTFEGLQKEISKLNIQGGYINLKKEASAFEKILEFIGIKGIGEAITGYSTASYKIEFEPAIFGLYYGTRTHSEIPRIELGKVYLSKELSPVERAVSGISGAVSLAFVVSVAKGISDVAKALVKNIQQETIKNAVASAPKVKFENVYLQIEKVTTKELSKDIIYSSARYEIGNQMLAYKYILQPHRLHIELRGQNIYLPAIELKVPKTYFLKEMGFAINKHLNIRMFGLKDVRIVTQGKITTGLYKELGIGAQDLSKSISFREGILKISERAGIYGNIQMNINKHAQEASKLLVGYVLPKEKSEISEIGLRIFREITKSDTRTIYVPNVKLIEKLITSREMSKVATSQALSTIKLSSILAVPKLTTKVLERESIKLDTKTLAGTQIRQQTQLRTQTLLNTQTLTRTIIPEKINISLRTQARTQTITRAATASMPTISLKVSTGINTPKIQIKQPAISNPIMFIRLGFTENQTSELRKISRATSSIFKNLKPSLYAFNFNFKLPRMNIIQKNFFRPLNLK